YMIRNCQFDPILDVCGGGDSVERCMRQVAWSFRFGKPAVICSHRANYVGAIDAAHRAMGLGLLRRLLEAIVHAWPDVWFVTTPELGQMIEEDARAAGITCGPRTAPENGRQGGS
ncbi:MAG TPA: hypothetical protein VLM89_06220, partial [Phycisphaerae bacterium]|nr:hypothetical protein [Phycisphaerae bacterium]